MSDYRWNTTDEDMMRVIKDLRAQNARLKARLSALEEHMGEMEAYVDSWGDTGIQLDDWLTKAKEILRGE